MRGTVPPSVHTRQEMTSFRTNAKGNGGHAPEDEHAGLPSAVTVTVPACTAVQITTTPCGGAGGAGSEASSPLGATVDIVHWTLPSRSVSSTSSPTLTATVRPVSAKVSCRGPAATVLTGDVGTVVVVVAVEPTGGVFALDVVVTPGGSDPVDPVEPLAAGAVVELLDEDGAVFVVGTVAFAGVLLQPARATAAATMKERMKERRRRFPGSPPCAWRQRRVICRIVPGPGSRSRWETCSALARPNPPLKQPG
jgi:hypothetical protein